MSIVKISLGLILFHGAIALAAGVDLRTAVVKVESKPCGSERPGFLGSGLLFMHEGKAYVLTSEHVVLHPELREPGAFCETVAVLGPVQTQWPARTIAAEWGNGLALLEVSDLGQKREHQALVQGLPSLSAFERDLSAYPPGSKLILVGVPHGAQSPLVDSQATLLARESHRHLFAMLPSALEVQGHGEFGMSGGAVLSADGSRFLATLSHQFVRVVPGRRAGVGVFEGDLKTIENDLIAIPAQDSLEWIREVLSHAGPGSYPAYYSLDGALQAAGREIILAGGLLFEARDLANDENCSSRVDGSSVGGGGQGVGVGGGGQGVGAGGESRAEDRGCRIVVSLDRLDRRSRELPEGVAAALKRVHEALLRGRKIEIRGFVQRAEASGVLQKEPIRGMGEFFRKLQDASRFPIIAIPGLELKNEIQAAGHEVLSAASSAKPQDPESRTLLNEIQLVGELCDSGNSEILAIDRVQALSSGRGEGWKSLFVADLDGTIALLKAVRKLDQELARHRL